ncbi:MAG: twin-arginine translocase TatA/TatE family subunit [Microgenomates group bacterium]
MPRIGTTEIIVIAIVILVLFGGKKLPELVKGIAAAIKEFRNAFKDKD